ncbi:MULTISPECIES: GNAT family N-acetyltransferase [unclassified Sphingomonas]|uniref:GNAT family N-acetyltransferase n=1 Tax=Sphingomonas TaxID=13687 RepID=UPI000967EE81|nr:MULTISPECIES: GNAT family protein [unclassified Sphingomonas]MBN8810893.1 GNAT family N-acetyltransferase [Sphingomonas sp.]OJY49229.1 MAG: GNAT family N-acetyltransferase [Sphingomonas sp. 67-41]
MTAWREVPTLAGRHVTLRPMARADRVGLLLAFAGLRHLFHTTVPDDASIDAWMDRIENDVAAGRSLPFTVLDAEGRIAGATRFLRMSEGHRRVEIGGTLYAPRVQRTGLNTEAKYLLLHHAFDELQVNCVQIRTDFLNQASRRAIERLGARMDGVLRGHLILKGHMRDSVVYSILAHEWPGVRRNIELLMARYEGEAA